MSIKTKMKPITIERKSIPAVLGTKPSFVTVSTATDVGFIQPTSGNEKFNFGKGSEDVRARLYCPMTNTEILYGDRITQNGQSYSVLFANQPTGISGMDTIKSIARGKKQVLLGYFKDGS